MKISRFVFSTALTLLAACSLTQSMEFTPSPSPSRQPLPQSTLVPTSPRNLHIIETPSPAPTTTLSAFDCRDTQPSTITSYTITAEMQYVKRELKVAQEIVYTNATGNSLSILDLNVKSNWQPGIFRLQSIELPDGTALKSHLVGQKLEITLPQPFNPNCTAHIILKFELHLPPIDIGGPHDYQGYLGYDDRQTNLGQWLPVVAARNGTDWVSHEEIPIGEQDVLDVANWDVDLHVSNEVKTLQIAAPGTSERLSETEWHFSLSQSRDFSLSIGENYRLLQQKSNSGVNVELYTFPDAIVPSESGSVDTAAYALNTAIKSVNLYETLYGSYPLKRLVIVQGDFPDGMEFSGIVFVGGEYFKGLSGVQSYLTIITAHEVAHQWWYAKVGSDQAIDPWMDEALATYSELVFIEKYYPDLKDWWWDFRVNRLSPQGFVDSTVYEFTSRRAYINAVYLRGVKMLNDLRTTLGDDVFFGWLNRYVSEGEGRIMTSDQFWSLLTPEQIIRTEIIRERYLRKPQITPVGTPVCSSETACTSQ